MEGAYTLLAILSAIWVYWDASRIGMRPGVLTGFFDMGPVTWAMGVLMLWFIVFPLYFVGRRRFQRAMASPVDGLAATGEAVGAPADPVRDLRLRRSDD